MSTGQEFYTVRQAAAILLVKERTIRQWLRDGTIHGTNLGGRTWRIPVEVIQALKTSQSQPSPPEVTEDDIC